MLTATFVALLCCPSVGAAAPTTATIARPATAVAAGWGHTCALLAAGGVDCWGLNTNGQLGIGSTATNSYVPVAVKGITNAVAIGAGNSHTCAVLAGGDVACWGANADGELGDGSTTGSNVPVTVSAITNATAITGGLSYTCAVLSGGGVACWGANSAGQLGNGTTTSSDVPVAVKGITSALAISASNGGQTCALLSDGGVDCWGPNGVGQLGNGTTTSSNVPVAVKGISNAVAIGAGYGHMCAVLSGGDVTCWGDNGVGELGNGASSNAPATWPVLVNGITNATTVTGGNLSTCAVLAGGSVDCWGSNSLGQLGNGTEFNDSYVPIAVSAITNAIAITAGEEHTCALVANGGIECWGLNADGQLGDGTTADRTTPTSVSGISGAPTGASGSAAGSLGSGASGAGSISGSTGASSGGTHSSGPIVSPPAAASGASCPSYTVVYSRRVGTQKWKYTIRIHQIVPRDLNCRLTQRLIRRADNTFSRDRPGLGVYTRVSPWQCRRLRPSGGSHLTWLSDCKWQGPRLSWTETQLNVRRFAVPR